jgi:hypothetical protein
LVDGRWTKREWHRPWVEGISRKKNTVEETDEGDYAGVK